MKKAIILLGIILFCLAPMAQAATFIFNERTQQAADEGEWRQLFNGKDLAGWKHVGPGSQYVEDGMIKSHGGMGLLYWTNEKFSNCTLKVVFRMEKTNSNSGVFIRIPIEPYEEWMPVYYGYEVQIDNQPELSDEDDYHYTGMLYSLTKPLAKTGKPGPEWNTMEITLDGLRTIVYLNGVKVTDFKEGDPVPERKFSFEPYHGPRPESGYFGLQNHGDADVVFFKEVAVKTLQEKGKREKVNTMENTFRKSGSDEISRRKFVGMAASGAAAITILPSYTVSGLGHVAPSDKLYLAVVGCGGEGAADIQAHMKTPKKNVAISCLCDVDDRMAAPRRKEYPKAPFYHDWREMFDKESKNFDAVTVAIPDHNHALVGLSAMQLNKHLYLQKPLTHDIYEARILTEASKKYKVVTQMGDQGASTEGMRTLREWIEAGLLGDIEKVYCWTDRPVWPQGIAWPKSTPLVPKELNWDLWLGTAQQTNYIENLVPFNWRGWWPFGTGALGDMGCHIMGPPFKLLELGYPTEVSGSASTVYDGIFSEAQYPESGPVSSSIKFKYTLKNGKNLDLYWMDGGITPERPMELDPDANMNEILGDWPAGTNDYEGATLFIGTKGKAACGWGGRNPVLLPLSRNKEINVPKKYARVDGDMDGHYWQWIDACIAGYGNAEVDSPFEGYAGPLTETVLMGNLLLRSFNIREKIKRTDPVYGDMEGFVFPGRYINFKWDGPNMRITNFEAANQFVKREYRKGWGELKI